MQSRVCTFALIGLLCVASLVAQQAPPREPHELLAALNRIQIDPAATYKIDPSARIELRRGDGKLMFDEGYLAFFQPLEGKVTGAVFSGRARTFLDELPGIAVQFDAETASHGFAFGN